MPFRLAVDPITNPEAYDQVYVSGVVSTAVGIVEVTTPGLKYKLDKKKGGSGTKKGSVTHRGTESADVKIKFKMWTESHFAAWPDYQSLFEFDPTKKNNKAIEVLHPALAFLQISTFLTETISPIVHEGKGLYTVTVELAEHSPAPKTNATTTPTSIKSNPADQDQGFGSVRRTAETEQERERNRLLELAGHP